MKHCVALLVKLFIGTALVASTQTTAVTVQFDDMKVIDFPLRAITAAGNWGTNPQVVEAWEAAGKTGPLIPPDYIEWLKNLHVNWVGLSVALHYDDSMDSTVGRVYSPDMVDISTFSDKALRQLIREFSDQGINVYLTLAFEAHEAETAERPVQRWQLGDPAGPNSGGVPCCDPDGYGILPKFWPWRPDHPDHERFVAEFWETYTQQAVHFARIAQDEGVGLYSLGTETDRLFRTRSGGYMTNDFGQELRSMVERVRAVYSGLLTYDMHYSVFKDPDFFGPGSDHLWDDLDLDIVGVSAWFPLTDTAPTTAISVETAQMKYEEIFENYLKPLAERNPNRPIVFLEYGITDFISAPAAPGASGFSKYVFTDPNGNGLDDGRETQANTYQGLINAMANNPGVLNGVFYWDNWITSDELWKEWWAGRRSFAIRGKLAEDVVRSAYESYIQAAPSPTAPTDLAATAASASQITLTWRDNSDNETGFRVQRQRESSGGWVEAGTTPANAAAYSDTGLLPATAYRYRVQAFNDASSSAFSNEAMDTTKTATGSDSYLFVPVLLTSAGHNNAFFTSELTLTNRGNEPATLNYTYTAHRGGGSGTATARLAPGRQRIERDAIGYLKRLGVPIPESGSRIGTLRVGIPGSSAVSVVTRTTTAVPEGRAGLSYLGIAEGEGFQEAIYLCGLRQNSQDRSNVAFQNMGAPADGSITLRTTVFSGNAAHVTPRVLRDLELGPGEFHQYNAVLGGVDHAMFGGYVKVERVAGTAPFYAYGVINDQANSDGSFVFPVTESSLVGTRGQTLPVIIETGAFTSELTLTNFAAADRQVDFSFVADAIGTSDSTATFNFTLKAGEQRILPDIVAELRRQGVAGIGPATRAFVGALFATSGEEDMSGIVIGARTGAPDTRGGQYSLFYNAVPYGRASMESAWIYGLQQNAENRSNLALVNTGEIDDSSSTFEITIYDGSGESQPKTVTRTVAARRWHQVNGVLGRTSQGYVQVRKISGSNPFVAYGVVNDGGRPGERSGDGAFLLSQE